MKVIVWMSTCAKPQQYEYVYVVRTYSVKVYATYHFLGI